MRASWSVISIISRFGAQFVGIVQSFIILRLITVAENGLINIVIAIGAIVGVYQNLGISSGSTREIASAENREEAFKVFIGSLIVRYMISLPLAIGLFVLSGYLGEVKYGRPEIILPIRIYAVVLIVQALQSVLNSVIQGLKQFKFLFTFQFAITFVSLIFNIVFLMLYGVNGFFYAMLAYNVVSTGILLSFVLKLFAGYINFPNFDEAKRVIKSVFSIGMYIYLIKILFTQWQKLGPIVLAVSLGDEKIGLLTFAANIASKVAVISDAVTDVTLPSMTQVYEKSRDSFKDVFSKANSKAYLLIMFVSVLLILLKREAVIVIDFVLSFIGKTPIYTSYFDSFRLMDPIIIAYWAFAQINLLKSGLSVPTKKLLITVAASIVMFAGTLGYYFYTGGEPLFRFAVAMGVGAVSGYIVYLGMIWKQLGFIPLTRQDLIYTLVSASVVGLHYFGVNGIILAAVFAAATYTVYGRRILNKE